MVRPLGLKHVAVERDFYEVQDLQPEDIEVIRCGIINPSEERLRQIHENLLAVFAEVAELNRYLARNTDASNDVKATLAQLISNLDEDYHTAIEHDLQTALRYLLSGSVEFFSDVRLAGPFLRALALQSLRTKKRRATMCERIRIPVKGASMERIWGPMIHMLAINIGASLLRDRVLFRIVLLQNRTDLAFITGDQPVISVNDELTSEGSPAEVEFYYPLSPTLGMWFGLASKAPNTSFVELSKTEVHFYNAKIVENHHEQLYAKTQDALVEWTTQSAGRA